MGMEPNEWAAYRLIRATQRLERLGMAKHDKDMAGWAYDGNSGYYALVQRREGKINVLALSRDKQEILRVGREVGIKKAEELKFGTHMKDQITGGHMYTEGLKAISERCRVERVAEQNRHIAELSPESAELRARLTREAALDNDMHPNPDPHLEIRRERAMLRMHGYGYPVEGLEKWTVEQLEEFVTHLDVTRMAHELKPEVDLQPKTEGLEARLEEAAMNHVWGEGEDPPEADLGPDPDPTPQMPGGTGEAMEPDPNYMLDLDHTYDVDKVREQLEAKPEPPKDLGYGMDTSQLEDHERAAVEAQMRYAEQLQAQIANSPDPHATAVAAQVMRNLPTTGVAADRPSKGRGKGPDAAPTKGLTKRLGKR